MTRAGLRQCLETYVTIPLFNGDCPHTTVYHQDCIRTLGIMDIICTVITMYAYDSHNTTYGSEPEEEDARRNVLRSPLSVSSQMI